MEAYHKIAGRRLPAPAQTHNMIASWGHLGAGKVLIGRFGDFNLGSTTNFFSDLESRISDLDLT